jgi:hypothetical protein
VNLEELLRSSYGSVRDAIPGVGRPLLTDEQAQLLKDSARSAIAGPMSLVPSTATMEGLMRAARAPLPGPYVASPEDIAKVHSALARYRGMLPDVPSIPELPTMPDWLRRYTESRPGLSGLLPPEAP